jgi:hypothetical protein
MRLRAFLLLSLTLAGAAAAQAAGARLLRDDRGKIAGVAGIGTPCAPDGSQCMPYSATGTVTKVDRDRDGTLVGLALKRESGSIELESFGDGQGGLNRNDRKDLSRWLRPGLKVTVSGTTSAGASGALVDGIVETAD